jgi:ubiquinone/menaquinone biosynthesis C-methylase UbiE
MIRTYFNTKAPLWDAIVAERDEAKLQDMAERLTLNPVAAVLDVGTGTGIFLPFILERLGTSGRLVALDIAEEMLKKARAKNIDGVTAYLNADVASIPLADGTFDGVVCYSSFPHFQDKMAALAEMYRVLRDGGHLFICHTSSREHINGIHCNIPEVCNDTLPGKEEMWALLSEAGFTEIQVEDNCESYFCSALKPIQVREARMPWGRTQD